MPITPELQAKIDALEDEKLRTEVVHALTALGNRKISDDELYELIVADYYSGNEHWEQLRKWQDEEVAAFAQNFKDKRPDDYIEFLRQEKEFNEIEAVLAWDVCDLIKEWMPGLNESDVTGLFSKFRDYAKSHST